MWFFFYALQRLSSVLDEVESLKPEYLHRVDELKKTPAGSRLPQIDAPDLTSFSSGMLLEGPAVNRNSYLSIDMKRVLTQLQEFFN